MADPSAAELPDGYGTFVGLCLDAVAGLGVGRQTVLHIIDYDFQLVSRVLVFPVWSAYHFWSAVLSRL